MSAVVESEDELLAARKREREEFIALVRENERLAAADPVAYQKRLKNLVRIGYGYVWGVLIVAILLTIALVLAVTYLRSGAVIKLAVVLGIFIFALLKALWVRIPAPDDLSIKREQAPELWHEVETIAKQLDAPIPDEILLDYSFNAAAIQYPRFGIFGGYRQYLLLGMPLLAGFSAEAARGVIAHEFGHLSGGHSAFGTWIGRVEQVWSQLFNNLHGSQSWVFTGFVNWFFPKFSAASFAIRRQNEYEADQAAAKVIGALPYAKALTKIGPAAEHFDRSFWRPFGQNLSRTGEAGTHFLLPLVEIGKQPLDPEIERRILNSRFGLKTDYSDTHPSLTDRLRGLDITERLEIEREIERSAAEVFFGDRLPVILQLLEAHFMQQNKERLKSVIDRRASMRTKLDEMEKQVRTAPPSEDEIVEMEYIRASLSDSDEQEEAIFQSLFGRFPNNAHAAYFLGEKLLERDDEAGIPLLEKAMADRSLAGDARRLIAMYHLRMGDAAKYEEIKETQTEANDRESIANRARVLLVTDQVSSSGLTESELTRLRTSLRKSKKIARAFAIRKRLPGTGEDADYLFLVSKRGAFVGENPANDLLKSLGPDADLVRNFIVVSDANVKSWSKKFNAIPGALVYDAKSKD